MEKDYLKGLPKIKNHLVKGTAYARFRRHASFISIGITIACGLGFYYSSVAVNVREKFKRRGYFDEDEEMLLQAMKDSFVVSVPVDSDGFPIDPQNLH